MLVINVLFQNSGNKKAMKAPCAVLFTRKMVVVEPFSTLLNINLFCISIFRINEILRNEINSNRIRIWNFGEFNQEIKNKVILYV